MTFTLTDVQAELVLKHLAHEPETAELRQHLDTYLNGYEWDVVSAGSFDGGGYVTIYRRNQVVAREYYHPQDYGSDEAGIEAARAKVGYPEAVKRPPREWGQI
ncbi:hypothetical protein [Prescottella agglutinans]|uniref:Uncharacterized protein n=1 Tax=Prescottella agglutinans TaxID=1644129 RepID=A0ABT6MGC1_9NOCA|nr:hypothetical protein [Prescottella agglutinans]MDH6282846.1 hypothetical protein [Prescottella agglutinans]